MRIIALIVVAVLVAGAELEAKVCQSGLVEVVAYDAFEPPARKKALELWEKKVAERHNASFAKIAYAKDKVVTCQRSGSRFKCTVKAKPCRP